MPGHQLLVLLLQLGVLLGLALALGRLAVRLGTSAVVGELAAGVLLGPTLLGHAGPVSAWLLPADPGQWHLLDAVGQLGVLLLVGVAGMYIDLGLVRRKRLTVGWVSAGGLLVPLGFGIGAGLLVPAAMLGRGADRTVFALFLGVALAVSAIPVIARILLELRLLHRDIGQLTVSAAAVNDIAGWLLLSVVSGMAVHGVRGDRVALSVAALVAVVGFAVLAGRPACRAVLSLAGRSGEPGVSLATVVVLVLLSAAGTHALGLEPILGAFLAGILVGASGRLDPDWATPLRTFVMAVLAPVFFATAGLRMDLTALARPVVLLTAVAVLAVAVASKFAGAYLGARAGRLSHWEGLALGAGLNARGVIQVVVATVGLRVGILSVEAYTVIVLVAVVTSSMAAPMLRYAMRRIAVTGEERDRERVLTG
jgi:Kef-type K+ transport system membrane component KefB